MTGPLNGSDPIHVIKFHTAGKCCENATLQASRADFPDYNERIHFLTAETSEILCRRCEQRAALTDPADSGGHC